MKMDNEIHSKYSSQSHLDAVSSNANNLGLPIAEPTATNRTSNLSMSTACLTEGSSSSYPLTHHYHYIQHPAYYQRIHSQTAATSPPPATCHCTCACDNPSQRQRQQESATNNNDCHSYQGSVDSQMAVAVIVHRQAGGGGFGTGDQSAKTQSEQSLLNHSYQTLQVPSTDAVAVAEDKPLNVVGSSSKVNLNCDCHLDTCTCAAPASDRHRKIRPCGGMQADVMLGIDEITISESDNNSTMLKKKKGCGCSNGQRHKKLNSWCTHGASEKLMTKGCDPKNYNSSCIDIYSDGEAEATAAEICLKDSTGNAISGEDHRPPLPPRPPPRTRNYAANTRAAHHRHAAGIKKYVVWCLVCGGFSCLLGILFLGVYFLLHSYTITVGNFETVPTFVPATLLILTGLCIMSLARRRNRYSYLIKLSGACGLISALTCALVTVTTTVLHMSRLQALRECEYAQKTRTCTCYSDLIESQVDRVDKEGVRLVFDSLSDCGVVHGSLYSCLRAIFGLSVAGVLIAVFSCMLVYQLLSHERKKMYWEQLELRCRSLYTSQQGPPPNMAALAAGRGAVCSCCEQCHAHRQMPLQASAYPWDDGGEPRFWTGQPPGNFYSPNPGGEDPHIGASTACRGHGVPNTRSRMTGWSWPRMPWQRSSPDPNSRFRQTPSSPDSQYGFSNSVPAVENIIAEEPNAQTFNVTAGALPYGVWGPPPPYSDPNSPARRGYYQYIQPLPCNSTAVAHGVNERPVNLVTSEQHMSCGSHRSAYTDQAIVEVSCCVQGSNVRNLAKRQANVGSSMGVNTGGANNPFKSKADYENTPSDSDGVARDRFSNTLPTRKVKKRVEAGAKSIGTNSQPAHRVKVQNLFTNSNSATDSDVPLNARQYTEALTTGGLNEGTTNGMSVCNGKQSPRSQSGIENTGFQGGSGSGSGSGECGVLATTETHETCDPTESEVYFADVSSCCNMSVKNDNYYEDARQQQSTARHHHHHNHQHQHQHQHQHSNCSHNSHTSSGTEDFLTQRYNIRQNSTRSRLPFAQLRSDNYEDKLNVITANENASSPTLVVNHMQKEISRQSMCSVESEAKTEFTDLSPATPCNTKFSTSHFASAANSPANDDDLNNLESRPPPPPPNFVASLPYCSETQSLEAHRRSTKNLHELILAPPDVHYEIINDTTEQYAISPKVRSHKPTQRPTNLTGGSKRNELVVHKSKSKSKSKERLADAPNANTLSYKAEVDWCESAAGERQRL